MYIVLNYVSMGNCVSLGIWISRVALRLTGKNVVLAEGRTEGSRSSVCRRSAKKEASYIFVHIEVCRYVSYRVKACTISQFTKSSLCPGWILKTRPGMVRDQPVIPSLSCIVLIGENRCALPLSFNCESPKRSRIRTAR